MSDNVDIVIRVQDKASGEIRNISASLSDLGKDTNFAKQGFDGLQGVVGAGIKVATGAAVAGIAAVGAGLASSVGKAADFEQAMSKVAAISRASDDDLARLTETAKQMGATTSFTAKEAAEGMSYLAMAGFGVNDIIAAMPGLLATAAAGNTDLATTADIVSNVLSGFNIDASQTGKVADILAATFTSANTDLIQLGDAMKYVAPVAASLGVPIEEVAAGIGLLSDAGIQGSMAGTTMRGILSRLVNPTGEAADILQELGINAMNADGSMKSFIDILGMFERSGITSAQAMTIFGDRAGPGMLALLGRGSEGLENLTNHLYDSGGVAQEVASRQLDNLRGVMTLLGSAVDGVQVAIGEKFLPVLMELIRWVTGLVSEHGPKLIDFFGNIADGIGYFISEVKDGKPPLVALSGMIVRMFPGEVGLRIKDITQGVIDFVHAIENPAFREEYFSDKAPWVAGVVNTIGLIVDITKSIVTLVADFVSWKDILIALGIVVASIVIPALAGIVSAALPVIAVAAALIAGVALLRNAWEHDWLGIRTFTLESMEYIKELFGPVLVAIQAFGGAALGEIWAWVQGNETSFWALSTIWETVKAAVGELFTTVVRFVQENLPKWVETLVKWGEAAWDWIEKAVPIVFTWVSELFSKIVNWIGERLPAWVSQLGEWAIAAWAWIRDEAIPKAVEWLGTWGGRLWEWLRGNIPQWVSLLGEWATSAWAWIRDEAIPKAIEWITKWYQDLSAYLGNNIGGWRDKLSEWGVKAWEWIKEVIPTVISKIMEWRQALFDFLIENLPGFIAQIGKWAIALIQWIGETLPEVIREFGDWLTGVIRWGSDDARPGFLGMVGEWIALLWQWVMNDLWPVLKPALLELLGAIVYALGEIGSAIYDKVVTEWIPALWEWVKDDLWPNLGPALVWLGETIVEALVKIGGWLWDEMKAVGENIVDGIKTGVGNVWASFTSWLSGKWKEVTDGVKTFFGIRSPSTLFAEIGANLMQGMESGIENNVSLVTGALSSVKSSVDGTIDDIRNSINNLGNMTISAPKVVESVPVAPPRLPSPTPGTPGSTSPNQLTTTPGDMLPATFGVPQGMSDSAWFNLPQATRDAYMSEALGQPVRNGQIVKQGPSLPPITNQGPNFADQLFTGIRTDTHNVTPAPKVLSTNQNQLFDAIFGANQRHRTDLQELFKPIVDIIPRFAQQAFDKIGAEAMGFNPLSGKYDTGSLYNAVVGLVNLQNTNAQQVYGAGGVGGGERMLQALESLVGEIRKLDPSAASQVTNNYLSMQGGSSPQQLIETIKMLDLVFA